MLKHVCINKAFWVLVLLKPSNYTHIERDESCRWSAATLKSHQLIWFRFVCCDIYRMDDAHRT